MRWNEAEGSLLHAAAARRSRAHEMAAAATCEPRGGDDGTDAAKIDSYARQHADVLNVEDRRTRPHSSWRGPKLILVHDQLERIAHWATEGDAAATLALLTRLRSCCEATPEHDEL